MYMAVLSPEDEARIRAEEELRLKIRKEQKGPSAGAFAGGCFVLLTLSVLLVVVIAAISSHTGESTTPGLQPIKELKISTPCTQDASQLLELLRLATDTDSAAYVYRQSALMQAAQSISLDAGATVQVHFEMEGLAKVDPITGSHAGAQACYVPSAALR